MIINQTLATKYFPGEDPIGKSIIVSWNDAVADEIVGVVGDVRQQDLETEARATIYWPPARFTYPFMTVAIRTAGDPRGVVAPAVAALHDMDPNVAAADVRTMEDVIDISVAQRRLTMLLLSIFAGLALVLAAVGIYGVIGYSVSQRTQEIGIRMALGAPRAAVLRMVVGQAMALALAGVAAGAAGAWLLSRLMQKLLFGVTATDPLTFLSVSALLGLVAALAAAVPGPARHPGGPGDRAAFRVRSSRLFAAAGIILLLIGLTALYVAAEFGAVGVRRSRLRRLCEDGNPAAARLLPIVEDPQRLTRYIAGSQVGITLSGMALGAYAEAFITPRVAPLVERWTSLPARDRRVAGQRGRPDRADDGLGGVRRDGAEDRRAALSHRDRAAHHACRCCGRARLYAWFIVVLDRSSNVLRSLLRVPPATAPPRALARGDRAAHRREPRRRPARAAGAGAAAPRAAPRAARRRGS